MENYKYIRGRGAQINPNSPYEKIRRDESPLDWALEEQGWEQELKTEYLETHPKTILNKVESPDIPLPWSLNPYQGCEHGCIYCYARNSHAYWGFSPGMDFERKILVKRNAAELLAAELKKPKWQAAPVMFAGNTDVYQPAERKFKITRACLEVFWQYRHPVSVITKNSLILRDLDILKKLASERLVHTAVSITTLDEDIRQLLEPRTASVSQRLKTVKTLSDAGIPVFVMMGPVIPGLNEHEIFSIVKTVADLGALGVGYTMVRLNGAVSQIFEDWVRKAMPDRAEKILHKIRDTHGGNLYDFESSRRMKGDGKISEIVAQQFKIAKEKFLKDRKMPAYNLDLHEHFKSPQLKLIFNE